MFLIGSQKPKAKSQKSGVRNKIEDKNVIGKNIGLRSSKNGFQPK
jgi:hypothetical protein